MPEEQLYVGTKLISAFPISKETFDAIKNNSERASGDTKGYQVKYPDGYISWSPKEVFENAYRLVTDSEKKLF